MVLANAVACMKDMLDAISNLLEVDLIVLDAFPQACATPAEALPMACPIKLGDRAVGAIGFTCRNRDGKGVMAERPGEVENLLRQVAALISAKLLDQENLVRTELMAEEVETLLDSVDRSIIAVDNNGAVLRFNKSLSPVKWCNKSGQRSAAVPV